MISKLAYNNIKKSYRIYFVYIFTLTLTIALFYGFNALETSEAITTLAKENAEYTKIFLTLMSTTSYFVSFFVVFLMVYASDFFFKVRSKEYYIYKTLGMSKKELVKLIFLENIIVGIFSIILGIIIGIFFNQILSTTLVNYINLDNSFKLTISMMAIVKTTIYFIGLLGLISVFSAIRINKKTIIQLKNIQSVIVKKQMKMSVSVTLMVVAIIFLLTSYFMGYISELNPTNPAFLISIASGFIGTIFAYNGLINFKNTKFKKTEHKKSTLENSILFNRLMKNKMSISVISVSFVFILTSIFGANALISLFEFGDILPTDAQIASYVPEEFNLEDINLKDYGLDNQGAVYNTVLFTKDDYFIPIVKQSEFNDLLNISENKPNVAEENFQYFVGKSHATYDEKGNNTGKQINNKDGVKNIKLPQGNEVKIAENKVVKKLFSTGVLVVADKQVDTLLAKNPEEIQRDYVTQYLVINYKSRADEKKVSKISKDIENQVVSVATKEQILKTSLVFKVSILFVTLYVAFFLVIISLAILAIQQIMDAIDNQNEYRKLKILGLNNKNIKKIINKNTRYYFVYPLILAFISSIFALIAVDHFVQLTAGNHLLNQQNNQNTIYILIILVIIYIIYIELVKSIYYKIVGVK